MNHRLPVFLIPVEQHDAWTALLWEQGYEPVAGDQLPDPRSDLDAARTCLAELTARHRESSTDALTGLPVRREALRNLEEEAALVEAEPFWLALLNVDNLKAINDNFGVQVGDELLTTVGRLVQTHLAAARVLGRVGGDTFLAGLRGDADGVRASLGELCVAVRSAGYADRFLLTVSVGLARHRPGEDIDELIDRADRNLFAAKNQGRDRVVDEGAFHQSAAETDLDAELADFENRVRVFADRLIAGLTGRGRRMVEGYRDETDHDTLTGLFNRRYFDRRLVREVQRSRKLASPLTVVMVNLDDLKAVNRLFGYPTGDAALKAAAQVVLKGIRVVDWAARTSGGEFCAVFPDTGADIASIVAERMRKALTELELSTADGVPYRISGSFGVVTLAETDSGVPAFLDRAARAVVESQRGGRDRVTTLGDQP